MGAGRRRGPREALDLRRPEDLRHLVDLLPDRVRDLAVALRQLDRPGRRVLEPKKDLTNI